MVDPNTLTENLGEIAVLAEQKVEEAKSSYRFLLTAGASKAARKAAYNNLERVNYFYTVTQEALNRAPDFLARIT